VPTITIGNNTGDTYSGVIDTHIQQGSPGTNFATVNTYGVYKEGSGNHAHGLIYFPVSSLPDSITVSALSFRMRTDTQVGSVSHTFTFRRVLRDWISAPTETTWNDARSGLAWTTGGGLSDGNDRAASPAVAVAHPATASGGTQDLDVTALAAVVEGWASGAITNYGLHIERTDAADDGTYKIFSSSDEADGFRPFLTITYTEGSAQFVPVQRQRNRRYVGRFR
jgi:hypothetical protein